jgi:putative DNA primase/helicase
MTTDLRSIAVALGGVVSGRQVLAPGPGHSPQDRSLAVRPSPEAPDGMLIHSHAGDDWRQCREYVRSRLGLPAWQPGDGNERQRTIQSSHVDKWDLGVIDAEAEDRTRTEDDIVRIERAQALWSKGSDPRRTAAEDYLRSRALVLPDELVGNVLRFHPECPWRNENTGRIDRIPCLLAAFRSIDDDIITAVHRIRLDQPKRWPKTQRLMLGVVRRAAVQLAAPADGKLAICEGVETGLAAMQLGVGPAWALGSVGSISFFPVMDGISQLTILGEAGDASARAIKICGRRWRRASRRVFVSRSTVGSDHNDALMQQRVS